MTAIVRSGGGGAAAAAAVSALTDVQLTALAAGHQLYWDAVAGKWKNRLPGVAQVADNTGTFGNARGAQAVDWQQGRSAAGQVASGAQSTVGGGNSNQASGTYSTVPGGLQNTASGNYSFAAGYNCLASANVAVALGDNNQATGPDSWTPGGYGASTRGIIGKGAFGSRMFNFNQGSAQSGELSLSAITTDATATLLTSDGQAAAANNQFVLPNAAIFAGRLLVVAREPAGAGKFFYEVSFMVRRDTTAGSTLVSVGTPVTMANGTTTGWAVALSADTVNGGLAVTVTGAAGTTVRWVGRILSVELMG